MKNIFLLVFFSTIIFSSCKKEVLKQNVYDNVYYEVTPVTLYTSNAEKNKQKSSLQYISILFSDLFNQNIPGSDLNNIGEAILSIGDKGLANQLILRRFGNDRDLAPPRHEFLIAVAGSRKPCATVVRFIIGQDVPVTRERDGVRDVANQIGVARARRGRRRGLKQVPNRALHILRREVRIELVVVPFNQPRRLLVLGLCQCARLAEIAVAAVSRAVARQRCPPIAVGHAGGRRVMIPVHAPDIGEGAHRVIGQQQRIVAEIRHGALVGTDGRPADGAVAGRVPKELDGAKIGRDLRVRRQGQRQRGSKEKRSESAHEQWGWREQCARDADRVLERAEARPQPPRQTTERVPRNTAPTPAPTPAAGARSRRPQPAPDATVTPRG